MKYMLDTNICKFSIKKKSDPLLQHLLKIDPRNICISSITQSELYYGVSKSLAQEKNLAALEKMLTSLNVLPFESAAARCYGEVRADLEKRGKIIGPLDLLIASHALSLGLVLVTNNVSEFKRVKNLSIEDWTVA